MIVTLVYLCTICGNTYPQSAYARDDDGIEENEVIDFVCKECTKGGWKTR